jgi:hypothetical protein
MSASRMFRSFIALVTITLVVLGMMPTKAIVASTLTNSDDVYVALSDGTKFVGRGLQWSGYFCSGTQICKMGDVNGDGKADAIAFVRTTNGSDDSDVYVALSDGTKFGPSQKWQDYFCTLQEICAVGDVNGDGKADIISFVRTNNGVGDSDVWVALSDGTKFGPGQKWHDYFCTLQEICAVGDVNGDGKVDVISFVRTNNGVGDSDVWVALSDGTKFGAGQKWQDYFCTLQETCAVGDVNGDGKADVISFVRTNNGVGDSDVWVALSDGTKFGAGQKWQDYFCTLQETCAVGDVNGDGKADIITFVRTSGRGNDDDVYVAFSDGTRFGPGQKWHDYFCTLQEVCSVGDVNGDGKADVVTFVRTRADNPITSRTIDVTVSLYRATNTSDERAPYEAIMGYFADAIFEMSNGTQRVGTVTIYQNGQMKNTANVVWTANVWPASSVAGWSISGAQVGMADVFPFGTPYHALDLGSQRGAGYTLGHEWGHYFYGLYDEYQGKATCGDPAAIDAPQTCDVAVPDSVMTSQWNATSGNYTWLNFSIAANQTRRNADWRVYGASGWEVLSRSPNNDPRDGSRKNLPQRGYFPELAGVAPQNNQASSIELPNSEARTALRINWINPILSGSSPKAAAAGNYVSRITSLSGDAILYPEAARLVASVSRDGDLISKAEMSAAVTNPDSTTTPLIFRDDGVAPDAQANDGLYSTIMPYTQAGTHHVTVDFSNNSGIAEFTYLDRHYTPGPNGETFDPQPHSVGENFNQPATTDIVVSGYPEGSATQQPPAELTVDNQAAPGRIDAAGDKDSFTFTADQTGQLVLRITDLAFGMNPHVRIYKGDPAVLIGDYRFVPQGDGYFFTKLVAQADDRFLVEVAHVDPAAAEGLYDISVGPALLNTVETRSSSIYLPLILR